MMARCKLNPCCGATMPGQCEPPPQIKPNEGWEAYEQRTASLSPAATPVPEAEPLAWVIPGDDTAKDNGFIDAMAWQEGEFTRPLYDRAALAKPASSPAGGDVREAQIEAGAKAIRQARVNGITPPEEGTAYDRKLAEACLRAALSQSTSPAESPTASGETVGSFRDRGPGATNPPGRGGLGQDSTSGEVGE